MNSSVEIRIINVFKTIWIIVFVIPVVLMSNSCQEEADLATGYLSFIIDANECGFTPNIIIEINNQQFGTKSFFDTNLFCPDNPDRIELPAGKHFVFAYDDTGTQEWSGSVTVEAGLCQTINLNCEDGIPFPNFSGIGRVSFWTRNNPSKNAAQGYVVCLTRIGNPIFRCNAVRFIDWHDPFTPDPTDCVGENLLSYDLDPGTYHYRYGTVIGTSGPNPVYISFDTITVEPETCYLIEMD